MFFLQRSLCLNWGLPVPFCDDVADTGFYTAGGPVATIEFAEELVVTQDITDFDFVMLAPRIVMGNIFRSPSDTASNQINPRVIVEKFFSDGSYWSEVASETVSLQAAVNTSEFKIELQPGDNSDHRLSYRCFGCENTFEQGFYASGGTTVDSSAATILSLVNDQNGLQLAMLDPLIISGQLSRPTGADNSAAANATLTLITRSSNGIDFLQSNQNVTIPAGQDSVAYSLPAPPLANAQFSLKYFCFNCDGIQGPGYYTLTGSVTEESAAQSFTEADGLANRDIEMLPPVLFSGELFLPAGYINDSGVSSEVVVRLTDPDNFNISSEFREQVHHPAWSELGTLRGRVALGSACQV